MSIVMNMSSYAIEEPSSAESGCDERVMNTGWNPQLELATQQHLVTLVEGYAKLPASLLTADAEMFLEKMHAYQC
jgi:hypothetical protein